MNSKGSRFYRKMDRADTSDYAKLGLDKREVKDGTAIRAIFAGEYRPPKRGEWYLSGASVGAYKAANDLVQPFHIAKLVKVETDLKIVR